MGQCQDWKDARSAFEQREELETAFLSVYNAKYASALTTPDLFPPDGMTVSICGSITVLLPVVSSRVAELAAVFNTTTATADDDDDSYDGDDFAGTGVLLNGTQLEFVLLDAAPTLTTTTHEPDPNDGQTIEARPDDGNDGDVGTASPGGGSTGHPPAGPSVSQQVIGTGGSQGQGGGLTTNHPPATTTHTINGTPLPEQDNGPGFVDNAAVVAGIGGAVAVLGLAIVVVLVWFFCRKRAVSKVVSTPVAAATAGGPPARAPDL